VILPWRRVTLEAEPGPPTTPHAAILWTVVVNGSIRYHGQQERQARRAYHWARWKGHREKRGGVPRSAVLGA